MLGWRVAKVDHALVCARFFRLPRVLSQIVLRPIVLAVPSGVWVRDELAGVNVDVMVWSEHCSGEETISDAVQTDAFDASASAFNEISRGSMRFHENP